MVGIPIGTDCAPLIANLFLCCYETDFMPNLHKSKKLYIFHLFNDTSRYLDDILTIDFLISLNIFYFLLNRNGIGLKFNNIINALSLQRYNIQNEHSQKWQA